VTTNLHDVPDRPSWRSYAGVGLFAGMTVAPALWLAPLLLSFSFGGVLAPSPIITSFSQFAAILLMGIVLGPLVTSFLWVFTRIMPHRSSTPNPQTSGTPEPEADSPPTTHDQREKL